MWEHWADIVILLIILGMVALAVRILVGRKRQGRSCCGCSGCAAARKKGGSKEEPAGAGECCKKHSR